MKKMIWPIVLLLLISSACQGPVSGNPASTTTPGADGLVSIESTQEVPASVTPLISPTAPPTSSPIPIPAPITCTDDTCLDSCLQRIAAALPQTQYESLTGAYAGNDVTMDLVYYDVEDGQLGEPQFLQVPDSFKQFQQDTTTHQNIWRYASSLLSPNELKWIDRFEIFKSSNFHGWVKPSGPDRQDRSHWILGIEPQYAQNPVEFTYTFVHEYGHLISLNTDQIPRSDYYFTWSQNPTVCKQFLMPEGCSNPDSYMNLFYQKFWKDILVEWQKTVDRPGSMAKNRDEFWVIADKFYDRHSTSFVDDYAVKNIKEDFAESFMHFVLEPKPNGRSIAERKILFFYDFPELVALRQQMIQNVCSYTGE